MIFETLHSLPSYDKIIKNLREDLSKFKSVKNK